MDFVDLNNWLAKTTYGSVILGAIGSALFAVVFWLIKKVFGFWFPNLFNYLLKHIINYFDSHEVRNKELSRKTNPYPIIVHFTYHLMIVFTSAIASIGLTLEKLIKNIPDSNLDRLISYSSYGLLIYFGLSSAFAILLAYWEETMPKKKQ